MKKKSDKTRLIKAVKILTPLFLGAESGQVFASGVSLRKAISLMRKAEKACDLDEFLFATAFELASSGSFDPQEHEGPTVGGARMAVFAAFIVLDELLDKDIREYQKDIIKVMLP